MDFHATARGLRRVSPSYRIVPSRPSVSMPKAGEYLVWPAIVHVDDRANPLNPALVDDLNPRSHQLSHLRPLVKGADSRFRVGERELAALCEEDVEPHLVG